ncbi:chitinase [Pseudonocardiaceae bacterium YIM PH 21723]|nr:chitinase [Pseudonocardiaceae bacterium YIM PH 21723]
MRKLRYALATAALAGATLTATHQVHPSPTAATAAVDPVINSPYLYLGLYAQPDPAKIIPATGVKAYTISFINSRTKGTCDPTIEVNSGPNELTGAKPLVDRIRAAGGDVILSVGGWGGNKLGENCTTAEALAAAYQKVIDAYQLKALDIDIEDQEIAIQAARERVVAALKIVKQKNPAVKTVVTMSNAKDALPAVAQALITKARETDAGIDVFTLMPFDNGNASTDMAAFTKTSVDRLKEAVKTAFGLTDDQAYRKVGLSSMNGITDPPYLEKVTLDAWKQIVAWAQEKHLGRVSFWSVNRDYGCGAGPTCSGIPQNDWDFTKVLGTYQG